MAGRRIKDLYTRRASVYQRFFVQFLRWEQALETFFQANPVLHSGMKVLDAGCGSGVITRVLYHLASRQGLVPITFHGFDLTPAMLDLFREWIAAEEARNIHVQQADVLKLEEQLPDDWKEYDLIVSSALLEYIPADRQAEALTNLKRRLRSDGRLLILVTKKTRLTGWLGALVWRTRLFTGEALSHNLLEAGFGRVQFKPLPAGWNEFMLAAEAEIA